MPCERSFLHLSDPMSSAPSIIKLILFVKFQAYTIPISSGYMPTFPWSKAFKSYIPIFFLLLESQIWLPIFRCSLVTVNHVKSKFISCGFPQSHKPCPSHHPEFMGGLVTIPSHASCSWHLGAHIVFMNRYQHCQPLWLTITIVTHYDEALLVIMHRGAPKQNNHE